MKQIGDEVLCKYCLGCNKLENPEFVGYKRCKEFCSGYNDWQSKYYIANQKQSFKINSKRK